MRQRSRNFRRSFSKIPASGDGGLVASSPKAHSSERLDVYRDSEKPPIPCKQVGFLTDGGRIFERDDIESGFIKRAKQMGGDALVLLPPVKSVESPPGWSLYDTFLYEAVVVAYD